MPGYFICNINFLFIFFFSFFSCLPRILLHFYSCCRRVAWLLCCNCFICGKVLAFFACGPAVDEVGGSRGLRGVVGGFFVIGNQPRVKMYTLHLNHSGKSPRCFVIFICCHFTCCCGICGRSHYPVSLGLHSTQIENAKQLVFFSSSTPFFSHTRGALLEVPHYVAANEVSGLSNCIFGLI